LTVEAIIEDIRFQINDYKTVQANVVGETPATGKAAPQDTTYHWLETATGKNHEEFLTKNMPVTSGCSVVLRTGRWQYSFGGTFPDDYADNGTREFFMDWNRGIFIIPSGAIPTISGDKVKLSYSWDEEQEYRFPDLEVKKWIPVGDSYMRQKITLPYSIEGRGNTLSLDPVPSGIYSAVLTLATSYFMRKRLEEEGLQDGIFVRDGDIAFDTTKTLVHRGKSLKEVKLDLNSIIDDIQMGDLGSAGTKIDIYSTRDWGYPTGIGSDQEIYYADGFPVFDGDGNEV
jgi:hypothetical protein